MRRGLTLVVVTVVVAGAALGWVLGGAEPALHAMTSAWAWTSG